MKEKCAKIIRIITVPPILAASMLLILYKTFGNNFSTPLELWIAVLFLVIVPGIAYPLSFFLNNGSNNLREKQRHIAFLLNFFGYLAAIIYSYLTDCTLMFKWIMTAYFFAVLVLTIVNKGFKIKASGHACSCVLPYLFLSYWLGLLAIIICICLYLIEFWASVSLKRHTINEFLTGSITAILVFAVTFAIFQM